MRIATEIKANWLNKDDEEHSPKSEVLRDEKPSGTHIRGAKLEVAVEWEGHFLLFTTDDCPFEEGLNIIMLDG